MDILNHQYHDLIERYVAVCNQAIEHNRNRFPFKQILNAVQEAEGQPLIEVVIDGCDQNETYVFQMREDKLTVRPHGDCKNCECVRSWNAMPSYLEQVTQNPAVYVDNPAMLDWEWIYES